MSQKALLVIDVQRGMFQDGQEVFNDGPLITTIKALIDKARTALVPIFFIQHNEEDGPLKLGTEDWKIHPALEPHEMDGRIHKTTPDSFFNTSLEIELQELGIDHLILTGIQTEICVDTTCRRAFSKGYAVTLVTDAHSTWPSSNLTAQQIIAHHNNALRWFAHTEQSEAIQF